MWLIGTVMGFEDTKKSDPYVRLDIGKGPVTFKGNTAEMPRHASMFFELLDDAIQFKKDYEAVKKAGYVPKLKVSHCRFDVDVNDDPEAESEFYYSDGGEINGTIRPSGKRQIKYRWVKSRKKGMDYESPSFL